MMLCMPDAINISFHFCHRLIIVAIRNQQLITVFLIERRRYFCQAMQVIFLDKFPRICFGGDSAFELLIISEFLFMLFMDSLCFQFIFAFSHIEVAIKKRMKYYLRKRIVAMPFVPLFCRASTNAIFQHQQACGQLAFQSLSK